MLKFNSVSFLIKLIILTLLLSIKSKSNVSVFLILSFSVLISKFCSFTCISLLILSISFSV